MRHGDCIISYDVTSLFTSVPIKPVLEIIQQRLRSRSAQKNQHDHQANNQPTRILFKQHKLCVPGSLLPTSRRGSNGKSLSPIVANIFMEHFEKEVLETAPYPPSLWKRFVDDTFVILETQHKEEFFHHMKSLDNNIKFTAENTRADGSIPFLDTLVTPKSDRSLQTKVYRKPTHTNQYLQWDSHHAMSNKYSVISSLLHRVKHICSSQELLEEEQKQIQEALSTCKYPAWAINRMKTKTSTPRSNKNNNQDNMPICISYITVPYNEGLSETFKNICKRYGIEVHLKSG